MGEFGRASNTSTSGHEREAKYRAAFVKNGREPTLAECQELVQKFLESSMRLPDGGPPAFAGNIAAWMLDYFFEPRDERDSIQEQPTQKGGVFFTTPYFDRMRYLCRKFLLLSTSEQAEVMRAREEGVFWRGDTMEVFRVVVKQTKAFNALDEAGKAAWRRRAQRWLSGVREKAQAEPVQA